MHFVAASTIFFSLEKHKENNIEMKTVRVRLMLSSIDA